MITLCIIGFTVGVFYLGMMTGMWTYREAVRRELLGRK